MPCGACQGEGRIITQGANVWDEIDHGWCPECYGECVVEVETREITEEDIEAAFGDWVREGRGFGA